MLLMCLISWVDVYGSLYGLFPSLEKGLGGTPWLS